MSTQAKKAEKPKRGIAAGRESPAGAEALMSVEDVAAAMRVSRRLVFQWISAGTFPAPDLRLGDRPRWRVRTYNRHVRKMALATKSRAAGG